MKKTWKTPFNYVPSEGEYNELASQTVPGQSKSISEMIKRVAMGYAWEKNDLEYTDEDDPLPIIKDLTDIDGYRDYVKRTQQRFNEKLFGKKDTEYPDGGKSPKGGAGSQPENSDEAK